VKLGAVLQVVENLWIFCCSLMQVSFMCEVTHVLLWNPPPVEADEPGIRKPRSFEIKKRNYLVDNQL